MDDYKGFILFGSDHEKGKYHDGESVLFGNIMGEDLHIANLLEIANNYFPNDPILSRLTIRHQPEIASYFMVDMGNIIFLNTTNYDVNGVPKYGKTGMIMLPVNVTEKQIQALAEYAKDLEVYDLVIKTDLKLNEGFLESKTLACMDKIDSDKLIKLVKNNCNTDNSTIVKH